MKIQLHADDFGVTNGYNNDVIKIINNGKLHSISLMANFSGFAHAVQYISKNKEIPISIHLDILEGKSILPKRSIPSLVNKEGYFKHSFFSLLIYYYIFNQKQLRNEIKNELKAQILKIRQALNLYSISLDGHIHIHLIPFIMDELISLKNEFNIVNIRMVNEPFFLYLKSLKTYFGIGLIKYIILKMLSSFQEKKLKKNGIGFNDYFFGALFTGKMKYDLVNSFSKRYSNKPGICTVLFHPGRLKSDDIYEGKNPQYYRSNDRELEYRELIDSDWDTVIK